MNVRKKHHKIGGIGGFTIVELVVAAVLVVIAVIAVVASVRKSSELQVNDYHRRQARTVIMRTFETAFSHMKFPGPYPIDEVDPNFVGNCGIEGWETLLCVPTSNEIAAGPFVIDERGEFVSENPDVTPLEGNMFLSVITEEVDGLASHGITIKVKWVAPDGPDSLVMFKRLMDVK